MAIFNFKSPFWVVARRTSRIVLKEATWIILNALPLIIATLIYYALGFNESEDCAKLLKDCEKLPEDSAKLNDWLYPDATFFLFWWYLALLVRNLRMFGSILENGFSRVTKFSEAIFNLLVTFVFVGTVSHLVLYIIVRLNGVDVFKNVQLMDLDDFLYFSLIIMLILQIFTYSFQYLLTNMGRKETTSFKLDINPESQIKIKI